MKGVVRPRPPRTRSRAGDPHGSGEPRGPERARTAGLRDRHPRAAERNGTLEAITTDLWYTLIYVSAAERRRLERERRSLWTSQLVAAGLGREEALAAWSELQGWAQAQERRGYAPSLPHQVDHLSLNVGRRLPAAPLLAGLDALLLGAEIRIAPGALEALRTFGDVGLRLGLVSNLLHETGDATRTLLDDLRLREHFGSIQLSAELPWSKPNPGPYRRCLAELRVAPSRSLHVGDQEIDPIGARRAGMRSLLYTGLHRWAFFDRPKRMAPATPVAVEAGSWRQVERRVLRDSVPLVGRPEVDGPIAREEGVGHRAPRAGA